MREFSQLMTELTVLSFKTEANWAIKKCKGNN